MIQWDAPPGVEPVRVSGVSEEVLVKAATLAEEWVTEEMLLSEQVSVAPIAVPPATSGCTLT